MNLEREQVADVLFTAAIVGVGMLLSNPVIAGVVSGIGINWAADLTRQGWRQACRRLLGESGLLNHDLQQAMVRAFCQTIVHLEQEWWKTPRGGQMRRSEPDAERLAREAFKLLREDTEKFCTPDRLGRAAGNEQVRELLYGDETTVRRAFSERLADYLHGHDPQLVDFIESHLVRELAFWFGEELKADRPESNRAWRAFQRLLLEGLQAGLAEVRADQQEILLVLNDLVAWADRMEARLPEERESTGQVALEQTLVDARNQIIDAIVQESGRTRIAIEEGLKEIARLMQEELDRLRPEIPPPPEPTRPPEVAEFVGREAELAYFAEKLATSHLAVITGWAGVGKTALAAILVRQVAPCHEIFWHAFHEGEGIRVIIWKLAGFLAWHGDADLWRMLHSGRQTGSQALPPEVLFDYLVHMLHGQGFLLCFDDLHEVDDDPLLGQLLERLRTELQAGEVSLIVTSRRMPPLGWMTDFQTLAGLSLADTRSLLSNRGLLLSGSLVADLYAHTEGNAQLLMLAIEALQRFPDPARLIARLAEEDDIERYLMAEVDEGLTREERAVMSAVAVLMGYGGTRDAIEAILGRGGIKRTLHELSNRHLLTVADREAGKEYSQHAMVQAFYYSLPGRRERQTMHQRAGEYYETEEPDPLKAARHFERAGQFGRAVRLATVNVWEIINQGQAQALRRLLERFTARQLDTVLWVAVNIARGQVYALIGEGQLARSSYQEALSQLTSLPDSPAVRELGVRSCRGMGELLLHQSPQEALDWLYRGLDELAGENAAEEAASLYITIGAAHIEMGEFTAARRVLEEGLHLLPEGASQLRASALLNLGLIYCVQGDVARGKDCYLRALEISQQLHDYWRMVDIWLDLGIEVDIAGDWEDATVEYRKALDLANRLGDVKQQTRLELALGIVNTKRGDDEAAQAHLSNCLAMAGAHNLKTHLVAGQSSLADLYLRQGEPEAAAIALAEAERLALEIDAKDQLAEIYRCWAQVHLARGQPQAALDPARRSVDLAHELGLRPEEGMSLRVLGQAMLASGQHGPAIAAFEQSVSLLADRDPYEAARTKTQWGPALMSSTEKVRGMSLLQEARSTFQRLGALRDLAVVEEILHSGN